jgi:uncharacterized protein YPO0396
VVFDEAFAKTDSEHSKLAMDIFDRLGFQMIMATPNKGVKAAEPYIGGAGFVYIQDRRISNISPILYDEARRALDWEGSAAALEAAKAEKAGKGGGGADPDQADS